MKPTNENALTSICIVFSESLNNISDAGLWSRAPWSARVIAQIPSEIALQSGVALHFRNGGILSMFDKNARPDRARTGWPSWRVRRCLNGSRTNSTNGSYPYKERLRDAQVSDLQLWPSRILFWLLHQPETTSYDDASIASHQLARACSRDLRTLVLMPVGEAAPNDCDSLHIHGDVRILRADLRTN